MAQNPEIIVIGAGSLAQSTYEFLKGVHDTNRVSIHPSASVIDHKFDFAVICHPLKFYDNGSRNFKLVTETLSRVAQFCTNIYVRSPLAPGDLGFLNQVKFKELRLFLWPQLTSGKIPLVSVSPRVPEKHRAIHEAFFKGNFQCAPLRTVEMAFYLNQSYLFMEKMIWETLERILKDDTASILEVMKVLAHQNDAVCESYLKEYDVDRLRDDASVMLYSASKRQVPGVELLLVCEGLWELYNKNTGGINSEDGTG